MDLREAKQIANSLAMRCRRDWSEERMALFATDLLASTLGSLPFDVVANTLRRLVAEVDPDTVTLARLIEAVKTKPAIPERYFLPPAEDAVDPTATGPAARGLAWRERHKIPAPTNLPKDSIRLELAQILSTLGSKMRFHCIRCRAEFREIDIDAYVLRLMDAGKLGEPEPPRWCARCTPVSVATVDADDPVPF
jgi:hypothetical protein